MGTVALYEVRQGTSVRRIDEQSRPGTLTFEAVVAQGDYLNSNRRYYPLSVLKEAFTQYQRGIEDHTAEPGLVDHPAYLEAATTRDIGIKWTGFTFEEDLIIGNGEIVQTEAGKDLAAVMRAGIKIAFSTRGSGDLEKYTAPDGKPAERILEGFKLHSIDAVVTPGHSTARLRQYTQEHLMQEQNTTLTAELATVRQNLEATLTEMLDVQADLVATRTELLAANSALTEARAELAVLQAARLADQTELTNARTALDAYVVAERIFVLTQNHPYEQFIRDECARVSCTAENVDATVAQIINTVNAVSQLAETRLTASPRGVVPPEPPQTPQVQNGLTDAQLQDLAACGLL